MLQDEEAQRRSEAQRAELQRQDEARRADLRRAEEEQMRLAAQHRADAEVHAQRLAQLQQERMAGSGCWRSRPRAAGLRLQQLGLQFENSGTLGLNMFSR